MVSTAKELFDAACRQYAKHHGGKHLTTQFVCVPHQLPPRLLDSLWSPPEGEDRHVAGDHDCHAVMPLIDALTYQGHQSVKVRLLASRELRVLMPDSWQEQVLCQMYAGQSMFDATFRSLADSLDWDGAWPEVDVDRRLTGKIVFDEDGYASVGNAAMMNEDLARDAGLDVVDGHVYQPRGE